jgi:thioester reductase-like protein
MNSSLITNSVIKNSLITGVTGVVGSALLLELLQQTNDKVYVLIRSKRGESSASRLTKVLEFLETDIKLERSSDLILAERLIVLEGDLQEPTLGLGQEVYLNLTQNLDHIFHCAASVELYDKIEVAMKNSVVPTEQILELQKRVLYHRPCKLEYVSTVGVLGKLDAVLTEERVTAKRQFHNSYEQSKAMAEELIYAAIDNGQTVVIHRPSMVVGNSQTGKIIHFQIFYFILRFLMGQLTMGFLPLVKGFQLDTITSDTVAKILVSSSRRNTSEGLILHHCSGPNVSVDLSYLQELAIGAREGIEANAPKATNSLTLTQRLTVFKTRRCFKIPLVVLRGYLVIARALAIGSKRKKQLLAFESLLDYARSQQRFSNDRSRKLLSEWGIVIPIPDSYLSTVVRTFLSR